MAGVDGMINEFIMLNDLHPISLHILNQAYSSKTLTLEWLVSVLIIVYKKGVSSNANKYRGLACTCVSAKLYNRLLRVRLRDVLDKCAQLIKLNALQKSTKTATHLAF